MVLLTAVPVSAPPSILIGVMVATGAPPDAAGKATGAPRLAVGGAPASGGTAAAISALSSPPNMLSISEQAVRLRPAVNAKAKNRPFLSPCRAGIPLIMLSAARRRCPAPMRPKIEFGAQPPRHYGPGGLPASLNQQGGTGQGITMPLGAEICMFPPGLAGIQGCAATMSWLGTGCSC